MPRTQTITKTYYQFSELSDEAKEKAIEQLWDINVDYEWWESTYEDAEQIGCKITGFDIDRGSYCELNFEDSAEDVAKAILENPGESCETYKTAKSFLEEYNLKNTRLEELEELMSSWYEKDETTEEEDENHKLFNSEDDELRIDIDELKEEFLKDLSEDYLTMLRNEYEYQTSKEAIIKTIEANEYEFNEDGTF